jgi:hypothetical protein
MVHSDSDLGSVQSLSCSLSTPSVLIRFALTISIKSALGKVTDVPGMLNPMGSHSPGP